jgi:hypothetical protein
MRSDDEERSAFIAVTLFSFKYPDFNRFNPVNIICWTADGTHPSTLKTLSRLLDYNGGFYE